MRLLYLISVVIVLAIMNLSCESNSSIADNRPLIIKVVTIVTFQDLDAIDQPNTGEAFWWYTDGELDNEIPLPGGYAPVFTNDDQDHLLIITGSGKSNAASSIMALGLNDSFDLSRAYFLVAAISGGRPEVTTIGSAIWVRWVVDSGLASEIDPRELPENIEFPFFRLGCTIPQFCTDAFNTGTEIFELNNNLRLWAANISDEVELANSNTVQMIRDMYPQEAARQNASVQLGDSAEADTFFHGEIISGYLTWWVENFTDAQGQYFTTSFEDTAISTALQRLQDAGLIDFSRFMLLRSPSNFDQQYPGQSALESLQDASGGGMPDGSILAFENVYLAGSAVANHIIENWEVWKDGVPPLN